MIPKMLQIEGALNFFSDPSFQFLLANAQRAAAASERNADYDMLSELLICRIEKGQSRKTRTGISQAIEIIDKIDDDALCALTVFYAIHNIIPQSLSCKGGIQVLADLFKKLMYMDLPTGTDWIDHLDILRTIRINTVSHFKKMEEFYPHKLEGYSSVGIKVGSDDYKKAIEMLSIINLNPSILHSNEFCNNYVVLPVARKNEIQNLQRTRIISVNDIPINVVEEFSETDIAVLESIWDLYTQDTEMKEKVRIAFMEEWDSHPTLKKLHIWWNKLPCAFGVTHVGTVLAHTNAKRCDRNIPELPLAT